MASSRPNLGRVMPKQRDTSTNHPSWVRAQGYPIPSPGKPLRDRIEALRSKGWEIIYIHVGIKRKLREAGHVDFLCDWYLAKEGILYGPIKTPHQCADFAERRESADEACYYILDDKMIIPPFRQGRH